MAGRTSRYTNPEAIIEIPFDPVLYLKIITQRGGQFDMREDVGCVFVPLVGKEGW